MSVTGVLQFNLIVTIGEGKTCYQTHLFLCDLYFVTSPHKGEIEIVFMDLKQKLLCLS